VRFGSWLVVLTAALAAALTGSPALGQVPAGVSPGWYAVPALGLTAEYDSNVFGTANNRRDDVLFRVSPGLTLGYVSEPLTILGRYILGAEAYADNSDLNGINRQAALLDARYLPTRRLRLGLFASFLQSDSVTGLAAPGARLPATAEQPRVEDVEVEIPEPDRELTPIPSAATRRQETTQILASPRASFDIDRLTSINGAYTYRLSDEENQPTDTEHTVRLGVRRRLTPIDRATANYIFRYFDSDDDVLGQDSSGTSSHAFTVGYGRRLTPRTDVSAEIGPRFEEEGNVGVEARAAVLHRFRTGSIALSYSRTQSIVSGRGGPQTVDTLAAPVEWIPLRRVTVEVIPGVAYYQQSDDGTQGDRDTLVYGVTAAVSYRLTEWLSVQAAYVFRYESEDGGDDFPRHVVSLGLAMSYPIRLR
jgi:hypothetical protein